MARLTDEELREAMAAVQPRPPGGKPPVAKPPAPQPVGLEPVGPKPVKAQPVKAQPVKVQPREYGQRGAYVTTRSPRLTVGDEGGSSHRATPEERADVKAQPPASRTGGPAPQPPRVGPVKLSPAARPGASGKPFLNQGSSPAGKQVTGQLKGLSPQGMKVLAKLLRPEAQTALAQEQRRRESITANQRQPKVGAVKLPPAARPGASGKPFLNQGSSPAGKQLVGQLKGLSPEGMRVLARLQRPEAQTALAQEQGRRESITDEQRRWQRFYDERPGQLRPVTPEEAAETVRQLQAAHDAEYETKTINYSLGPGDPGHPIQAKVRKHPTLLTWVDDYIGAAEPMVDLALEFTPNIKHALDHPDPKDRTQLETALVMDYAILRAANLAGPIAEEKFLLTPAGKRWLAGLGMAGPVEAFFKRYLNPGRLAGEAAGGGGGQIAINVSTGRPWHENVGAATVMGPVFHAGTGMASELWHGGPHAGTAPHPEAPVSREPAARTRDRAPASEGGFQPHRATPGAEPHAGKQPLPVGQPGVTGKPGAPHAGPAPHGGGPVVPAGAPPKGRAAHPGASPGMHPPETAPAPAGKPGLPEASPPKRSPPEMEITAPEQQPGAVGVSGEPGHPFVPEPGPAQPAPGGKSGEWEPVRRPQVHVNPEGRVHVEGHGIVEPHDAAALASVDDAFRRGGPEAKARALEALPPEQRSRVEVLWNGLEQRGALGDVAEAGRARRGAGRPGAADPQSPHSVPESPAPRETVPPRSPEAGPAPHGEEPRPTRGNEPEPVVGEHGARAESPTPEAPHGDPRAELDASSRAWERTQGGRRYAGPEPHAVQAALPVARALQRVGVEGGEELLAGLRRQLGAGHGEEFYRAVAAAVEREGTPHGGSPGTPRPEVAPQRANPAGAVAAGSPSPAPGSVPEGKPGAAAPQSGAAGDGMAPRPGEPPAGAPEGTPRVAGTGGTAGSAAGSAVPDLAGGAAPRPGAGNRVFTPERAEAARQRLAPVLPDLRGGGSGKLLRQVKPALMELGGFHYEAGARQFDPWAARLRGEVGADTFSTPQLQALWVEVKPATNKALNQAARWAESPRPGLGGTGTPGFSAGRADVPAGSGSLRDDVLFHLQEGLTREQLQARLRAQGHDPQAAGEALGALLQEGHVYPERTGRGRVYRATPTPDPAGAALSGPPARLTPEARRALVRRARAAEDPVELWDRLRQLGIEDPTDPRSRAALERMGLRKHVESRLNASGAEDLFSQRDARPRRLSRRGRIHSALRNLPSEQRKLWTDREALRKMLITLYNTHQVGNSASSAKLVEAIDEILMAGLRALSLDRMDLQGVELSLLGEGEAGVLRASGQLQIDYRYLYKAIAPTEWDCPGAVWKTWIHEAIHGRRAQQRSDVNELKLLQGYEDGFAELFARFITVEQARMTVLADSYNYYVQAYEMLVRAAGVEKRDLLRKLNSCHPGTIRAELPRILGELKGREYSPAESDAIRAVADELFQSDNAVRSAGFRTAVESWGRWRKVLR